MLAALLLVAGDACDCIHGPEQFQTDATADNARDPLVGSARTFRSTLAPAPG